MSKGKTKFVKFDTKIKDNPFGSYKFNENEVYNTLIIGKFNKQRTKEKVYCNEFKPMPDIKIVRECGYKEYKDHLDGIDLILIGMDQGDRVNLYEFEKSIKKYIKKNMPKLRDALCFEQLEYE